MKNKAVCFKKSNVEDLKEKLTDLLSDKNNVEEYKADAQEYICGKYDWDDVVDKTVKVYER